MGPIECKVCKTVFVPSHSNPVDVLAEMWSKGWKALGTRGNFCPMHAHSSEAKKGFEKYAPDAPEMVDHPAHYGGADNPYEAIKVIEAWKLDFSLGNAVKYIARAAHKGSELEDLRKGAWYLNHRIKQLEELPKTYTIQSGAGLTGGGGGVAEEHQRRKSLCQNCATWAEHCKRELEQRQNTERRESELVQRLIRLTETSSLQEALAGIEKSLSKLPTHLELNGSTACGDDSKPTTTDMLFVTCTACSEAFFQTPVASPMFNGPIATKATVHWCPGDLEKKIIHDVVAIKQAACGQYVASWTGDPTLTNCENCKKAFHMVGKE